jgi:hypothetical protein
MDPPALDLRQGGRTAPREGGGKSSRADTYSLQPGTSMSLDRPRGCSAEAVIDVLVRRQRGAEIGTVASGAAQKSR